MATALHRSRGLDKLDHRSRAVGRAASASERRRDPGSQGRASTIDGYPKVATALRRSRVSTSSTTAAAPLVEQRAPASVVETPEAKAGP
ncbi:hypothetical protein Noca_3761 [Nocardioides sp. JS614]|nr:hypothetical protein Noca_3761 [Nocardioides sp. JS614]